MTREEALSEIDTGNHYPGTYVKHIISELRLKTGIPIKFKRGDVFVCYTGAKPRPVVVVKPVKGGVYGLTLSTTKDSMNLTTYNSRFYGKGYISKNLSFFPTELVEKGFRGVFDDNRNLNKAMRELLNDLK